MRDPVWVEESKRPEQRLLFLATISFCLLFLTNIFVFRIAPIYFELNILLVGIGYVISAYKSNVVYENIAIGFLWVLVGIITNLNFNATFGSIPIDFIIYYFSYFLIMILRTISIFKRQYEFIDHASYLFCFTFAILMAIVFVISFLGVGASLDFFHFADSFIPIGQAFIDLSKFPTLEFMSVLAVLISLVFQAPKLIFFYDEPENESTQVMVD